MAWDALSLYLYSLPDACSPFPSSFVSLILLSVYPTHLLSLSPPPQINFYQQEVIFRRIKYASSIFQHQTLGHWTFKLHNASVWLLSYILWGGFIFIYSASYCTVWCYWGHQTQCYWYGCHIISVSWIGAPFQVHTTCKHQLRCIAICMHGYADTMLYET